MNEQCCPAALRLFRAINPAALLLFAAAALLLSGCSRNTPVETPATPPQYQFETTGEDFFLSAIEEVEGIAEYAAKMGGTPAGSLGIVGPLPTKERKRILAAVAADTAYIYGEVTAEGYGAVVTERHAYPKGLLLITVRKSYGKPLGGIVTQTKRYITAEDFLRDSTQQSNITEVYGLSSDTIVTHVERNGILETYTFRLPVVTRVLNPQTGAIRVTTRYGSAGTIRSEVRDGDSSLVQIRITNGESDGATVVYTEYADASWRNVRTLGRADGSVFRDITSGP
jgi:hypothetical protein